MTRIHRLKHVECFLAAALAQNHPVGTHAQRVLNEIPLLQLAVALNIGWTRFHPGHMWLLELKFGSARMLDGSRFNAAIRPVGVDGPLVSIRKFSKNKLGLHRLVEFGAITQNMAEVLAAAVHARKTNDHFRGYGHRQDDHAQRAVGLYS